MSNLKIFNISVIIPVYNGEKYIEKAIESAFSQKDVVEVVVVEDGSTDSTLDLLYKIQKKEPRLVVLRHQYGVNKGRSKSRNLGIQNAKSTYIAFLDADDFYLPHRFDMDKKIFNNDNSVDGVYNAIGSHFYIDCSIEEKEKLKLLSVWEVIPPEKLFESMTPIGHKGYFSGDGLTVHRRVFDSVGFFNPKLSVAEDTELYLKMALQCKLIGGVIDTPVALRGVHDTNVFRGNEALYIKNRKLMYESLLNWSFKKNINDYRFFKLWTCLWRNRKSLKKSYISDMFYWISLVSKYPKLLKFKKYYNPLKFK
ncbi:hypothetical protein BTO05_04660 [Winogradskyella sp. PC-19]|uniref:glycosyltransferase family 2 protein n=1 Tax=unclassified Winogradskyella TaxID=2615021 RepID=UPI000B3C42D4|nr:MULTISPECIES: glycosyltransferase [unclassified Winogradskyella]ARV08959.1 hypothetical protein BTO05_04660 [Winogradskyella sp. PC-19]